MSGLQRFSVYVQMGYSQVIEVEAHDLQEAVKLAEDEASPELCHQERWEPEGEPTWHHVTDADGEVIAWNQPDKETPDA